MPKRLTVQPAGPPRLSPPGADPLLEGDEAQGLPLHLSLTQAILTWCDPSLVAAVQREEVQLTEHQHAGLGLPLLGQVADLAVSDGSSWMAEGLSHTTLRGAWDRLIRDFRRKIERRELFLEGVRLAPQRGTVREMLTNSWVAEMGFDLDRNIIQMGVEKFGAITVSPDGSAKSAALIALGPPAAAGPAPFSTDKDGRFVLSPEDVAELSDATILRLLEEHALRVVANDADLSAPGKLSLMPILRRRMQWRCQQGELSSTLAAEARVLSDWISKKVQSHQVPTPKSIGNSLRTEYAALAARSNAIKQ